MLLLISLIWVDITKLIDDSLFGFSNSNSLVFLGNTKIAKLHKIVVYCHEIAIKEQLQFLINAVQRQLTEQKEKLETFSALKI